MPKNPNIFAQTLLAISFLCSLKNSRKTFQELPYLFQPFNIVHKIIFPKKFLSWFGWTPIMDQNGNYLKNDVSAKFMTTYFWSQHLLSSLQFAHKWKECLYTKLDIMIGYFRSLKIKYLNNNSNDDAFSQNFCQLLFFVINLFVKLKFHGKNFLNIN